MTNSLNRILYHAEDLEVSKKPSRIVRVKLCRV
jgi:hypothetical protein